MIKKLREIFESTRKFFLLEIFLYDTIIRNDVCKWKNFLLEDIW